MSKGRPQYNLNHLRDLLDGDEEALRNMIRVFASSSPDILAELNRHFQTENWESLANTAHKLKSSIDLFDISELRASIREIESLAKAGSGSAAVQPLIDRLNVVMQLVFDDLEKQID
jgi:HPt (histidine-containing phosphotransfer) domain-containing protein